MSDNEERAWKVIWRADGMGWNVVVHDGLNIGPFEKDKADAIVRDHKADLEARLARAEAERDEALAALRGVMGKYMRSQKHGHWVQHRAMTDEDLEELTALLARLQPAAEHSSTGD